MASDLFFPTPGEAYNDGFFARALSLGGDYFESALMHLSARGDHQAVAEAVKFMSRDDHSLENFELINKLLWTPPHSVEVMVRSKGKLVETFINSGGVHHAVALSLFLLPLEPQEDLSSIRGAKIDSAFSEGWTHSMPVKSSPWSAEKHGALQLMVDLCRKHRLPCEETALFIRKHVHKTTHPVGYLLEALLDRSPTADPICRMLEGVEISFLKTDGRLHTTAASALEMGRVQLVIDMVNSYPAWRTDGQEGPSSSLELATTLSMGRRYNSRVFNGLFDAAFAERDANPEAGHLLEEEERACALIRLVCRRENDKAIDVLLRSLIGHLDRANHRLSGWSAPLVDELSSLLDIEMGLQPEIPWPLMPAELKPPNKEHGKGHRDELVFNLLKVSIRSRCTPLMTKLSLAFEHLKDKRMASLAWSEFPPEKQPTLKEFKDGVRTLQSMGVNLNEPLHPDTDASPLEGNLFHHRKNKARYGFKKARTSPPFDDGMTALYNLAGSSLPMDFKLQCMHALLELGANPHVKNQRGWTAASRLPADVRAQWQSMVRSHETRLRAMEALASINADEVFASEKASLSVSKGARP